MDKGIPVSTAKRYLDFAVSAGMLKHEGNVYMLTDRFTRPFRNIATYVKEWMDAEAEEDLDISSQTREGAQEDAGGQREAQSEEGEKAEEKGPDINSEKGKIGHERDNDIHQAELPLLQQAEGAYWIAGE